MGGNAKHIMAVPFPPPAPSHYALIALRTLGRSSQMTWECYKRVHITELVWGGKAGVISRLVGLFLSNIPSGM